MLWRLNSGGTQEAENAAWNEQCFDDDFEDEQHLLLRVDGTFEPFQRAQVSPHPNVDEGVFNFDFRVVFKLEVAVRAPGSIFVNVRSQVLGQLLGVERVAEREWRSAFVDNEEAPVPRKEQFLSNNGNCTIITDFFLITTFRRWNLLFHSRIWFLTLFLPWTTLSYIELPSRLVFINVVKNTSERGGGA